MLKLRNWTVIGGVALTGSVLWAACSAVLSAADGARESAPDSTPAAASVQTADAKSPPSAESAHDTKNKQPKEVDFNRDIRPILSDKCFFCHGPDSKHREADLRLDQEESAYADLGGYHAIVPGKPEESEVVSRITEEDEDMRMPAIESGKKLKPEEIALIKTWIEQGAKYSDPWAYVVPQRKTPPEAHSKGWAKNWIDAYILSRLEEEGLSPSREADRVTLLRRLSFDLRGLPPSITEVDEFVHDSDPDAYEKRVDKFLASDQFGERMAIWWLDLVRYADSVGYHGDQPHRAWPYRDYVINSFNANKPFDVFTREQLAGDFDENPTQEELVATCYNRLLQTSHEGGIQLKEYRAIYFADRVRNVSQVWMGATMGCCQCHDHKYDPYTTEDFYRMGAFFADIDDEYHIVHQSEGLNSLPTPRLPEMYVYSSDEDKENMSQIDEQLASLKTRLKNERSKTLQEHGKSDSVVSSERPSDLRQVVLIDEAQPKDAKTIGDWGFTTASDGKVHDGDTSRKQETDQLVHHGYEESKKPTVVWKDDKLYCWVYLDSEKSPEALMLQLADSSGGVEHRAYWGSDVIEYGHSGKDGPGYHRVGDIPEANKWVRLEVPLSDIGMKAGETITGIFFVQYGGLVFWDATGIDRAPVSDDEFLALVALPKDELKLEQKEQIQSKIAQATGEAGDLLEQIEKLSSEADEIKQRTPRVMYTTRLKEPRTVRVLPRGNWLDESGPVVDPAIPKFLGKIETGENRATRLDLANWLVRPAAEGGVGELSARVQVNRFWQLLMGNGIARVLDDFGGQGDPPVHPELLDALSIEFFDSGWDVKHMMKLITMSATYRQASTVAAGVKEIDADNRLYSHQSRPRLPAELIRDNALKISGLLVSQIGGPSVHPYQPEGYYRHLNFPTRKYKPDLDSRQYRRGVYVHWQRQFLHPMLKAFDAPSREECTAGRPQSNTPVASLVLLNDPTFVEAARAFAQRVLVEGGETTPERMDYAMRLAVSRDPTKTEKAILEKVLDASQQHYKANPEQAKKLNAVGMKPVEKGIDPVELATWSQVTRVILNMNEVITRN